MISEKEAKSIATAVFIEKYTREYLLTVVDRIAMCWSKSKGIFDMNFGIFPEIKNEDGETFARFLMEVEVDMKTGKANVVDQAD